MKRVVVSIVILTIAIISISVLFYLWLQKQDTRQFKLYDAVPENVIISVNIENFEKFHSSLKANQTWQDIKSVGLLKNFSSAISFIDSLSQSESLVRSFILDRPISISFINIPNQNKTEVLYSLEFPEGKTKSDLFELIKLQSIGLGQASEEVIDGAPGLVLKMGTSARPASYFFVKSANLLLVGTSKQVVEMAIDKLNQKTPKKEESAFQSLILTSAKGVDANVLVNTSELAKITATNQNSNILKGIAEWMGLDVQISGDKILANGLILTSQTGNDFYHLLTRQKPVPLTLTQYMPANTNFFVWYGISDITRFVDDYRDYMDHLGLTQPFNKTLTEFASITKTQLDDFLKQNLGNEVAVVNATVSDDRAEWFILLKVNSGSAAMQLFEKANADGETVSTVFKPDNQNTFTIISNPVKTIFPALLGNHFLLANDSYITQIDNILVLGSSVETLKLFAENYIRNNTLAKGASFESTFKSISSTSNLVFFSAGFNTPAFNQLYLQGKPVNLSLAISRPTPIVWQVVGGTPKLFAMLSIAETKGGKQLSEAPKSAVWVCRLKSEPSGRPHLVKNHTTGESEILVQDTDNLIYLINSKGHILWQRKIDSPILGDVVQVDLFRNRKLQMAFATSKRIYVIDRNGKDVENFPVLPQAEIASPLSVFDYDHNKNYRFVVAASNRTIYCFDSNGKPVKGWTNFKTETVVSSIIGLAQVGGNDYLIVFDKNRPYLLNRKGEERVKILSHFCKANNAEYYLTTDSKGQKHIVTTDTLGVIRKLYFDGSIRELTLKPYSSDHTFRCVTAEGATQYLYLESNTIYQYNTKGDLLNVAILNNGTFSEGQLQPIRIGGNTYLFASANEQLLAYNLKLQPLKLLNSPGTIPLVVVNEKEKHLVTLSKQYGVICFAMK